MTPLERRSSFSLASIFALRMLGLFLVLPVFALEARKYPGGDDPALVGLAMGMYGLTQAFLQLPLGMASDRFGRKRVILVGLGVFALGSLVAALATSVLGLLLGRALQGAGAVSAAVNYYRAGIRRGFAGRQAAISPIAAPVLVIWGDRDRYLGSELATPPADLVPNARVVHIPEASHWVQTAAPVRVNQLLLDFVRS